MIEAAEVFIGVFAAITPWGIAAIMWAFRVERKLGELAGWQAKQSEGWNGAT